MGMPILDNYCYAHIRFYSLHHCERQEFQIQHVKACIIAHIMTRKDCFTQRYRSLRPPYNTSNTISGYVRAKKIAIVDIIMFCSQKCGKIRILLTLWWYFIRAHTTAFRNRFTRWRHKIVLLWRFSIGVPILKGCPYYRPVPYITYVLLYFTKYRPP